MGLEWFFPVGVIVGHRKENWSCELTTEWNKLKLSGYHPFCHSIEPRYSKKFQTNSWLCGVGVRFVLNVSHGRQSDGLSQLLNQISWNFHDSTLIVIRLSPYTQRNSKRTVDFVVLECVLSFHWWMVASKGNLLPIWTILHQYTQRNLLYRSRFISLEKMLFVWRNRGLSIRSSAHCRILELLVTKQASLQMS